MYFSIRIFSELEYLFDILIGSAEGCTTNDGNEILILLAKDISYWAHFRIRNPACKKNNEFLYTIGCLIVLSSSS